MKTKFNAFPLSETWRRVKNHCRTTDNKDFTEKNPSDAFKKKLLMSEHSPIRLLEFDWSWRSIPYDGYANMQSLIDAWRKRLCYKATPEARELAEDFKIELGKMFSAEANILVPNCIYRGGCPEFTSCGFYESFLKLCKTKYPDIDLSDLQTRYDAYNDMFFETHKFE